MNDKINVVLKIKPLIGKEKDIYTCYWDSKQNSIFQIDPTTKKIKGESFSFDHIFNQYSTNQDIFSTVVQPIIDATIQGFNGTVIAYGQTSSGKTHTMTGTLVEPGIIPTAIKYMFSLIEKDRSREYLLRVSYLEIYKEKVNDLLGNTENIVLREDGDGQTTVKVEERVCNNIDKVLDCMAKGEKNRRIGETNMNERSSRSHTIFRVILESSTRAEDDEGFVKTSQLNLVDLAGSERCGQSGTTGERFKEGCHINNSLTVLSLVIKQLSKLNDDVPESLLAKEKGLKQTDTRQHYINYRGSKLTRLLKTSLGGNALTVIICTVTPTVIDQTQNTINFALRSKNVKNKPELNEAADDAALIKRYMRQIVNLSQELEEKEKKIAKLKKDFINSNISDTNENKMDRSKRRHTWGGKTDLFPLLPTRFLLSTINEDPSPSTLKRSTSDISGFSLSVKELECDLTETKTETSDEPREQNIWNRNVGPLKQRVYENNAENIILLENNKLLKYDLKQLKEKCQREQSELSEEIIKIRNENRLLVQQSEIVEDQNKGMKTQIEILEAKLKELENSSIAENKCQENIALLDIRDKEATENNENPITLLSTNQENKMDRSKRRRTRRVFSTLKRSTSDISDTLDLKRRQLQLSPRLEESGIPSKMSRLRGNNSLLDELLPMSNTLYRDDMYGSSNFSRQFSNSLSDRRNFGYENEMTETSTRYGRNNEEFREPWQENIKTDDMYGSSNFSRQFSNSLSDRRNFGYQNEMTETSTRYWRKNEEFIEPWQQNIKTDDMYGSSNFSRQFSNSLSDRRNFGYQNEMTETSTRYGRKNEEFIEPWQENIKTDDMYGSSNFSRQFSNSLSDRRNFGYQNEMTETSTRYWRKNEEFIEPWQQNIKTGLNETYTSNYPRNTLGEYPDQQRDSLIEQMRYENENLIFTLNKF